jgi:hypothetical protein
MIYLSVEVIKKIEIKMLINKYIGKQKQIKKFNKQ